MRRISDAVYREQPAEAEDHASWRQECHKEKKDQTAEEKPRCTATGCVVSGFL